MTNAVNGVAFTPYPAWRMALIAAVYGVIAYFALPKPNLRNP